MSLIIPGVGYTIPAGPFWSPSQFEMEVLQAYVAIASSSQHIKKISEFVVVTQSLEYGSIGTGIAVAEYPINDDPLNRVRYPDQLTTEDYLDVLDGTSDKIDFSIPRGMYRQFVSGSTVVEFTGSVVNVAPPTIDPTIKQPYKSDAAQYVIVTTNRPEDVDQWYPILTVSPLWDRFKVEDFIKFDFEEF